MPPELTERFIFDSCVKRKEGREVYFVTRRSDGLHPLIKRDAAIIFAINHGYSLEKTYDLMCELGLPPLDTGLEDE